MMRKSLHHSGYFPVRIKTIQQKVVHHSKKRRSWDRGLAKCQQLLDGSLFSETTLFSNVWHAKRSQIFLIKSMENLWKQVQYRFCLTGFWNVNHKVCDADGEKVGVSCQYVEFGKIAYMLWISLSLKWQNHKWVWIVKWIWNLKSWEKFYGRYPSQRIHDPEANQIEGGGR